MSLDYTTLELLKQNHPAWRLLRSDHAPLIAGFLHRAFTALARELLGDFREVEHNFRGLDRRVRERIALWEGGKGKLPGTEAVVDSYQDCLKQQGFTPLTITTDHALRAGSLPGPHRDPFDRSRSPRLRPRISP